VNFCKENSENPELTDRQAKKLIHWRVPTFLNTKNVCVCDGCGSRCFREKESPMLEHSTKPYVRVVITLMLW
jgi:hypothetical protein